MSQRNKPRPTDTRRQPQTDRVAQDASRDGLTAVAEETVQTINRYFAPRGVKHALNAFRDEFHSIWNRYPKNDKYLQSQVAADFLARLFVKQIERNDFKLRW